MLSAREAAIILLQLRLRLPLMRKDFYVERIPIRIPIEMRMGIIPEIFWRSSVERPSDQVVFRTLGLKPL
ncbi:hypothetical protein WK99_06465 [Burkholderia ubonensis]|nr:hypothetical protein WK99_06465 [Burkholderia ubonensis]